MSGARQRHRKVIAGTAARGFTAALMVGAMLAGGPGIAGSLAASLNAPPATVLETRSVPGTAVASSKRATALGRTEAPIRANLVGASWRGSAHSIEVRARGADGTWSAWTPMHAVEGEGPDRGSGEADALNGRSYVPVPLWVGDATSIETRVPAGNAAADITLTFINTMGTARASDRALTGLRATAAKVLGVADVSGDESMSANAAAPKPTIKTRAQWGADESIRRKVVDYAPDLRAMVLHHTVSSNSYSSAEVPAIIRGIYSYHVLSNGWNDIGYNFLVDKYGTAWEGRYGGMTKNVIGAHTLGFNTSTSGVALIGENTSVSLTSAQRATVTKLVSWRMDQGHANPSKNATLTSRGNERYPEGTVVSARAMSGHRDLWLTACPGSGAYPSIDSMRAAAWTSGGPKIAGPSIGYTTRANGTVASVRVAAVGNRTQWWNLILTEHGVGTAIGAASQPGVTKAAFSWTADVGDNWYPWEISAKLTASSNGTFALPWERRLASGPPPAPQLTSITRSPTVFTPNGDGADDRIAVGFSLNTPAHVTWTVQTPGGAPAGTVFANRAYSAGRFTPTWGGTLANGAPLANGDWVGKLVATDFLNRTATKTFAFSLDRRLGIRGATARFSPNGDGKFDNAAVRITADSPDAVELRVYDDANALVDTPFSGVLAAGAATLTWDGRDNGGQVVPTGVYRFTVSTGVAPNDISFSRTVVVDNRPPAVSAQRASRGRIIIWLGERALVTARIYRNGAWITRSAKFPQGKTVVASWYGARSVTAYDSVANKRYRAVT